MRQWRFAADMNFDGVVTISDVWLWIRWLFYYPGDAVVDLMIDTSVGTFFELSTDSFGGGLSMAVSLVAWFVAFVVFALMSASHSS